MKLSAETLEVLQNFSNINNNLWFNKGNTLQTVTPTKNIKAIAVVPDSFPKEFGIYDLDNLRSVISLFNEDYDIKFDDDTFLKIEGRTKIKYRYTGKDMISSIPPDKQLDISTPIETFEISSDTLNFMLKSAKVLQAEYIGFEGDGTNLTIRVYDKKDNVENSFFVKESSVNVNIKFEVDNLKMLSRAYHVSILKNFAYFKTADMKLQYWIGKDSKSKE